MGQEVIEEKNIYKATQLTKEGGEFQWGLENDKSLEFVFDGFYYIYLYTATYFLLVM